MHYFSKLYLPLRLAALLLVLLAVGCDDVEPPELISLEPDMGPRETLVVMQGNHLGEIRELTFNDSIIPFNTAYNSDVALLFRIPSNISLGEKQMVVRTDGGSFTTTFTVTEDPPEITRFYPRIADPGDLITFIGDNYFDPLEVTFTSDVDSLGMITDSVAGEIVFQAVDSLIVRVPEGARTGFIRIDANGGSVRTGVTFQTFSNVLVSDFDGNGIVGNDEWTFDGFTEQGNGAPFIRSSLPAPVSGNFIQLSGSDELGIGWIGGAKTPGGTAVDSFGITTQAGNTFLEFDVNSNGRTGTRLVMILQQYDSGDDFTHRIILNDQGWVEESHDLTRFRNSNGIVVNPARINQIKFHLEDPERNGQRLEANIDNVAFAERQ